MRSEPKHCTVSFQDQRGVTHCVQVQATSLYEALAFAVPMLRDYGWSEEIDLAHRFTVEARPPATVHIVEVRKLEAWTHTQSRGPREIVLKNTSDKLSDGEKGDEMTDNKGKPETKMEALERVLAKLGGEMPDPDSLEAALISRIKAGELPTKLHEAPHPETRAAANKALEQLKAKLERRQRRTI